MHARAAALAITMAALLAACDATTSGPFIPEPIHYVAVLNGGSERPTPNASTATGAFTASLDTVTNIMSYSVSFGGLSSPSTMAHIHGPATASQAAGIIVDFSQIGTVTFTPGSTSGTFSGTLILTAAKSFTPSINGDSLLKLIDAQLTYVNIHSVNFPGGEIRGQITKRL
jgi:CHRD domain